MNNKEDVAEILKKPYSSLTTPEKLKLLLPAAHFVPAHLMCPNQKKEYLECYEKNKLYATKNDKIDEILYGRPVPSPCSFLYQSLATCALEEDGNSVSTKLQTLALHYKEEKTNEAIAACEQKKTQCFTLMNEAYFESSHIFLNHISS